jgi:hypothetical protein
MSEQVLPSVVPAANPETDPFWAAASQGQLVLPRCGACGEFIWYPWQFCPPCPSFDIRWEASTGHGTVYSVRVIRRGAPAAVVGAGP